MSAGSFWVTRTRGVIPKLLAVRQRAPNLMIIGGLMFGVNEEEIQSSLFEEQWHLRIETVFE